MKKRALTLLLALAMIVSLAACGGGGGGPAGTYKLTKINSGGIDMSVEDMAALLGMEMNVTLELKSDGNFILDMSALGMGESVSGTWKGDGKNLVLSAEGEELPVTVDGKTIVLEDDGESLTFEKQ